MSVRKGYNRYFIIFQEEDKGYGIAIDRQPAGYAKIEVRNGKCRITVYAQNIRQEKGPYTFCLMNAEKKPSELLRLGEVRIDSIGTGETFWEFGEEDIAGSGQSVDRYDVAVLLSGEQGLSAPLAGFAGKDKIPWRDLLTKKVELSEDMRSFEQDQQGLEDESFDRGDEFDNSTMGQQPQIEVEAEVEVEQLDEEATAFREYEAQLREAALRQRELQHQYQRDRDRDRERERQAMAQTPMYEEEPMGVEMRHRLELEPRGGWGSEDSDEMEREDRTVEAEAEFQQQYARGHGHGKGSKHRPKHVKEDCLMQQQSAEKHSSSSDEHMGHMSMMNHDKSCYDKMDHTYGMKPDSSSESHDHMDHMSDQMPDSACYNPMWHMVGMKQEESSDDHMEHMSCEKHHKEHQDSSAEHHGYMEGRMPCYPKHKHKCSHADRFHGLLAEFEEVTERFTCHGIQNTRWWKIPAHYHEKMIDEIQYPYMSTIFHLSMAYPHVDYMKYFFRTGYYYFGIRYNKQGEVQFIAYGIRGRNHPADHPHRGSTGFRRWVGETPDGVGTWLMFYNPVTGNFMVDDK